MSARRLSRAVGVSRVLSAARSRFSDCSGSDCALSAGCCSRWCC